MQVMERFAIKIKSSYSKHSSIGKALNYFIRNFDNLIRFTKDPKLPIDNNSQERELRAPVVGRNLYNAIEGKDANQKIGEKQARLKELGALLNNPDLTPGLKEKYIAEHQKVVKDINSIQQDEISKLDEMSNTEKKTILDVARKKYDLRKQQDEIANSNLDAETKASEIQNIKNCVQ